MHVCRSLCLCHERVCVEGGGALLCVPPALLVLVQRLPSICSLDAAKVIIKPGALNILFKYHRSKLMFREEFYG